MDEQTIGDIVFRPEANGLLFVGLADYGIGGRWTGEQVQAALTYLQEWCAAAPAPAAPAPAPEAPPAAEEAP